MGVTGADSQVSHEEIPELKSLILTMGSAQEPRLVPGRHLHDNGPRP